MQTAAELYKQGKIVHFIVSGDNRTRYYNEPLEMQKALVKLGVPIAAITLDYAGLRTLDSIVRCKEIFGQDNITIITQPFHSYRALFISDYYDVNAVALVARCKCSGSGSQRTQPRNSRTGICTRIPGAGQGRTRFIFIGYHTPPFGRKGTHSDVIKLLLLQREYLQALTPYKLLILKSKVYVWEEKTV